MKQIRYFIGMKRSAEMRKIKTLILAVLILILAFIIIMPVNARIHEYDDLGRLVRVIYDNGDMVIFEYDDMGNMINRIVIPASTGGEPDPGNGEQEPDPTPTPYPPAVQTPPPPSTQATQPTPTPGTELSPAPAPDPPLTALPTVPASLVFTDVAADAWYHDYITTVLRHGLFSGMGGGIFAPQGNMTRAMFAQVLANLQGSYTSDFSGRAAFYDVSPDAWYSEAVEWAAYMGIVTGVANRNFAPGVPITREQMAVMLHRFIMVFDIELPLTEARELTPFADIHSISYWALESAAFMQAAGIIAGRGNGIFDPQATATRAEVATVFVRLLGAM
jgi:hypothetical protein